MGVKGRSGQGLLLSSLNRDCLFSLDTPAQIDWTSNLEARGVDPDVSNLFSEGGTLDLGTKVPQDFTKALEWESVKSYGVGRPCVCVLGGVAYVSCYTHPKHARANIHTYRFLFSVSRLHCTIPSLSCSGGATPTGFPLAPLPALTAPLSCRLVPDTGLRARPFCIFRALAPSPAQNARFPGLGDSHFRSPGASGIPQPWRPPHRFSMVPLTPSR